MALLPEQAYRRAAPPDARAQVTSDPPLQARSLKRSNGSSRTGSFAQTKTELPTDTRDLPKGQKKEMVTSGREIWRFLALQTALSFAILMRQTTSNAQKVSLPLE
jgi:hypothetical protein